MGKIAYVNLKLRNMKKFMDLLDKDKKNIVPIIMVTIMFACAIIISLKNDREAKTKMESKININK